jgi:hypothetical protein
MACSCVVARTIPSTPEASALFPRVATVKQGNATYRYLQIVEAYRDNGRPKQRLVATLGRLDQLGPKLDDLVAALSRYGPSRFLRASDITCRQAGPRRSALAHEPTLQRRLRGGWDPLILTG